MAQIIVVTGEKSKKLVDYLRTYCESNKIKYKVLKDPQAERQYPDVDEESLTAFNQIKLERELAKENLNGELIFINNSIPFYQHRLGNTPASRMFTIFAQQIRHDQVYFSPYQDQNKNRDIIEKHRKIGDYPIELQGTLDQRANQILEHLEL